MKRLNKKNLLLKISSHKQYQKARPYKILLKKEMRSIVSSIAIYLQKVEMQSKNLF